MPSTYWQHSTVCNLDRAVFIIVLPLPSQIPNENTHIAGSWTWSYFIECDVNYTVRLFPELLEFQHCAASVKKGKVKATHRNQCLTFPLTNWRSDRRCTVLQVWGDLLVWSICLCVCVCARVRVFVCVCLCVRPVDSKSFFLRIKYLNRQGVLMSTLDLEARMGVTKRGHLVFLHLQFGCVWWVDSICHEST